MDINLLLYYVSLIIVGVFIGSHTRQIYHRTGRNSKVGFLLGLILQQLGLIISLCLSPKNDFKNPGSFIKRFLFGFGRFVIFSIPRGVINEIYSFDYGSPYTEGSWIDLLMVGFGWVWIMRGNNFFKFSVDSTNNIIESEK